VRGAISLTRIRLPELVEGLFFTGHLGVQKVRGFDKLSQAGLTDAILI
jgi:hypothetical protein